MRNILTKNAPASGDLVQDYIDTAYDNVKLVADNLAAILAAAAGFGAGTVVYLPDMTSAIAAAISGLYDHKGGYDASANTPNLDAVGPITIEKADTYVVTVAGNFFATAVEVGDLLIADQATPTLVTHWTIINKNIDDSAFATAAQGATADTALQPGGVGTAAYQNIGYFALAAQGVLADSALQIADIDTLAELNAILTDATLGTAADFATSAQGILADSALQAADINTLAKVNVLIADATLGDAGDFATAAQGATADSAVQPGSASHDGFSDHVPDEHLPSATFATAAQGSTADAALQAVMTTKGDLEGFSTIRARIPIGTDTHVLTADSAQPLGLKWAVGGGSGGGMTIVFKAIAYTLVADDLVYSQEGLIHTLPITPNTGDKCSVWDVSDLAGTSAITVGRNGETINGVAADFTLNMDGGRVDFAYDGTTWQYSYVVQTLTQINPSAVIRTVSGTSDTLLASDNGKEVLFTNAAAIAVTLPDGFPVDWNCVISQAGAGTPTVTPATDTINGAGAGVAPAAQWKGMYLAQYASTTWMAKF